MVVTPLVHKLVYNVHCTLLLCTRCCSWVWEVYFFATAFEWNCYWLCYCCFGPGDATGKAEDWSFLIAPSEWYFLSLFLSLAFSFSFSFYQLQSLLFDKMFSRVLVFYCVYWFGVQSNVLLNCAVHTLSQNIEPERTRNPFFLLILHPSRLLHCFSISGHSQLESTRQAVFHCFFYPRPKWHYQLPVVTCHFPHPPVHAHRQVSSVSGHPLRFEGPHVTNNAVGSPLDRA